MTVTDAMQPRQNRRRRPRLSDAETERRMLQAGLGFVAEQGLSLSLEHLPMEELIHAAGVSRTSSYRRWPTKDLFAADLLLALAQATDLSSDIPGLTDALAAISDEVLADLGSAQGRRNAVVEVLRVIVEADFLAMLDSSAWRTYIALRAAHGGLPDGDLRARVADAISETERTFTASRAVAFEALAQIMGYRPSSPDPRAWERLSLTVGALAVGMLIRGYADREAVTSTTDAAQLGSTLVSPWSTPALATVSVVLTGIEPDPSIEWDVARVSALRTQTADMARTVREVMGSA